MVEWVLKWSARCVVYFVWLLRPADGAVFFLKEIRHYIIQHFCIHAYTVHVYIYMHTVTHTTHIHTQLFHIQNSLTKTTTKLY